MEKNEERSLFVLNTKQRGDFEKNSVKTHYYVCKFDGRNRCNSASRSPCRHGNESIKNTNCPARMYVQESEEGVFVKYVSCHNHELSFKNVKFYRWHPDTKNYIHAMLEKEIPALKIKADFEPENVDLKDVFPLKEHFITTTQISKIKYEFLKKNRLHKTDAVSVQLLVNSLLAENKNSVLVYKPQGKCVEIGHNNVKEILNDPDLFLFGFQEERQRIEMVKGCKKSLVIDATHRTNYYDFQLVNLIVPDEFRVGYPVGHFLTNRVDTNTMIAIPQYKS